MESLRDRGLSFRCFINDNGQEKRHLIRDISLAFYSELPLPAEIPFKSGLGMGRDNGNEKRAVTNLIANLAIPGISAPEFTLVEPDLDTSGPQRIADATRRVGVL